MEFRKLGPSGLRVSALALGTMTWGEQNSEADAHAQLDCALDYGVNLVDTAEMYPVAPRPETQGHTERFIGTWLAARPALRDRIVLATKIAGPGRSFAWIRGGKTRFDAQTLKEALEGSLRRLQTDYVDLYQLHWPERVTNFFGSVEYKHDPADTPTPPDETLRGLQDLITSGKVRHIGLSNETPWGVMAFLAAAERAGLPRVVTVQNPYNLLNRSYEIGLSEVTHREGVGLLAYSPLAMGVLSDKYDGGRAAPPEARMTKFARFKRYTGPEAFVASEKYAALAREHGLDPAQMALAWINRQPFVTSNLLGATTLDQLRANLGSADVVLSDEVCAGIEAIHRAWPNPAP